MCVLDSVILLFSLKQHEVEELKKEIVQLRGSMNEAVNSWTDDKQMTGIIVGCMRPRWTWTTRSKSYFRTSIFWLKRPTIDHDKAAC